jgi:LPS-assembly protein
VNLILGCGRGKHGIFFILLFIILINLYPVYLLAEKNEPYVIDANDISYCPEKGIITATGNVELKFPGLNLYADTVIIDQNRTIIEARGDKLSFITRENDIRGTNMIYNYSTNNGSIYGAESRINELNFMGGEIRLLSDSDYNMEIKEAAFTPCDVPNPHYQIKAKNLKIYPDGRIIVKRVGFFWGTHRLFSLPNYILEYRDNEFYNPYPIPHIAFNSKEGLSIEVYYPYYISDRSEGNVYLDISQDGGRELSISNSYDVNQYLTLLNDFQYKKKLEDESENSKAVISSGIKYKKGNLSLAPEIGYDFLSEDRNEELKINYSPWPDYKVELYYNYINEEFDKKSYTINYNNEQYEAKLISREGYELDYSPYLQIDLNDYVYRGFRLYSLAGIGSLSNEGKNADKLRLDLGLNKSIKLSNNMTLNLMGDIENHLYDWNINNYYQFLNGEVGLSRNYKINERLEMDASLAYELSLHKGEPLLPIDEKEEDRLIKAGLDFIYLSSGVDSFWKIETDTEYSLNTESINKAGIKLSRIFDCYSITFNYNLIDNSFGIGIDL